MEKIKTIELSLMNNVDDNPDNVDNYIKATSAKMELYKLDLYDSMSSKDFLEFLTDYLPLAYDELIKNNPDSFTHVGLFFTDINDELASGSYSKSLIESMEKYGENVSGITEAAKLILEL